MRSKIGFAMTATLVIISAKVGAAGEYNTATYDKIAAQARPVEGAPVAITTNSFLGWTGAWDTVVLKQTKIWEKWLPKGSTVEWKRNLQGPPVITDMLANKQQIAYLGDNPAVLSTTKTAIHPIHIVAVNLMSPGRMCGQILVSKSAPEFQSDEAALRWLEGKTVGVPKGSCADRLAQGVLAKYGIKVNFQQMQAEVIVTSLQAGKVDAAAVYEPHASKAVIDGYARFGASVAPLGEVDANAVLMRKDFVDSNRGAAIAWIKANIQALLFVKEKPIETIELVKLELPDYTREELWNAIYANPPEYVRPSRIGLISPVVLTPETTRLVERITVFLQEIKAVKESMLPPTALHPELARQAFTELGLEPNKMLFEIEAKPASASPFKGDQRVER